jgi:predicted PurR-regulated permease PerM
MPARRPTSRPARQPRRSNPVATLFGVVLVVAAVSLAKPVLVPLSLAVLFSFILNPLVILVQRFVPRRVPAVMVVVLLALVTAAGVGWTVAVQVSKLADELPKHRDQIQAKIQDLQSHGGVVSRVYQFVQHVGDKPTVQPTTAPARHPAPRAGDRADVVATLRETVPPATQPVVTSSEPHSPVGNLIDYATAALQQVADAGLVLILVIYFLIRREDTRNRLIGLLGHTRLAGTTRVTVETAQRLSKLLLVQLCVNASFGLIFGLLLLVIGVPYAFLWGFLTAVLRFIPYVGTWIAAAGPILLSFATREGWGQPIGVFVTFLALDTVTANAIEPLLFGHSAGVSPVALLVAAVFWTWIWGPVGLVLSTPITICLVVMGQHVPRLRVLWLLLGDRPPLPPAVAFYQRLLAGDRAEAGDVVTEQVAAKGLDPTYDEVLLPALRMARRERMFRGLTPADETFILDAAGQIIDGLGPAAPSDADPARRPRVLAIPAHHRVEELTLQMLAQTLRAAGCDVELVTTRALPVDIERIIERDRPDLVFVAVMPPGGLIQARYLCRRLGKRFAGAKIIVGYWGKARDFDRLLVRLRSAGASYVTTSIGQTRTQVLALLDRPADVPSPMA